MYTAIISITTSAISAGIVLGFRWMARKFAEANEERREDHRQELEEIQKEIDCISKGITEAQGDLATIKHTQRDQLRDRIMQSTRYWLDKGSCPLHEKEIISSLYVDYHDYLNGNGPITKRFSEFMDLPERKEEK